MASIHGCFLIVPHPEDIVTLYALEIAQENLFLSHQSRFQGERCVCAAQTGRLLRGSTIDYPRSTTHVKKAGGPGEARNTQKK